MEAYLAIGALLLIAAWCGDAALARMGAPRRWMWAAVMVAMCVAPIAIARTGVAAHMMHLVPQPNASAATERQNERDGNKSPSASGTPRADVIASKALLASPVERPRRIATTLPVSVWALGSLCGALLLLIAHLRLRRARTGWVAADEALAQIARRTTGRATQVLVSATLGPAALGFIRPAIVLPAWIAQIDARDRDALVRHEALHIAAGDTRLLGAAIALVVSLPWHLPLLLAYLRLRATIELDCDARVVASGTSALAYGRLLLEAARRLMYVSVADGGARAPALPSATSLRFGARRSQLEQRVRALRPVVRGWRMRTSVTAMGGLALMALVAACSVPVPRMNADSTLADRTMPALDSIATSDAAWATLAEHVRRTTSADSLRILIAHYEPEYYRLKQDGHPDMLFIFDSAGVVIEHFPARLAGIQPAATATTIIRRASRTRQGTTLPDDQKEYPASSFGGANIPLLASGTVRNIGLGTRAVNVSFVFLDAGIRK